MERKVKVVQFGTGKMAKYRQELRDITKQKGFPYEINWPEKPKED